jgi:hypothetical protein
MRKLKVLGLLSLLLTASIAVSAQSGNSAFAVSKDVQRVANQNAFDNQELKKSNIEAVSLAFPAIVISKGIVRETQSETSGNVASKGYPTWTISKGVARHNYERRSDSPVIDGQYKEDVERGAEITRK